MDRKGKIRLLTVAALPVFLAATADVPALPISEARWLAPGTLLSGLTRQPSECLALPADKGERGAVAIGRAAFRAPLLLGGQAARAGLSCASCHRNGRGNPDFLFPGISGGPGTADVTSSLMSKHRGDGTVNPKAIPDLAAPAATHKVARDPRRDELQLFIRGLIVEEFDGPEPTPALLHGLAAYVRAIRPEACGMEEAVRLGPMLADAGNAVTAASASFSRGDRATALVLVGAARSALGRIDERFSLPGLEASRTLLGEADRELQAVRSSPDPIKALRAWQRKWPERERRLRLAEPRSLFSSRMLRQHLAAGDH
jgi:mono/diheme cytochrome c family protein